MSRFLYLPMEIAARELDSRLLVALHAAAAGMEVILGQKWLLQQNIHNCPTGAWIFKTLTPGDAGPMLEAKQAGHLVCAVDEEIPGLGEGCGRLRWVVSQAMESCDILFCLGQAHRECVEAKFPDYDGKTVLTGNPRWDMLRPEMRGYYSEQAELIRQKHGRFILFNTNVGFVNSAKASPEKLAVSLFSDGRLNPSDPADVEFIEQLKVFESANMGAAITLVRRLAETFTDQKVILRPHPTERLDRYQEALSGLNNVEVMSGGPSAPWILASDLLIHTSCTTGVEAFALEKPSVSFEALASPLHDYFLSASLSRRTNSADDMMQWVSELLSGESRAEDWRSPQMLATFHRFFAGQEGDFAAGRMIAEIDEKIAGQADGQPWKPKFGFRRWNWRKRFQKRIFPDYTAAELQARMGVLARMANLPEPRLNRIGRAIYHLKQ